MLREIIHILHGNIYWIWLKVRYLISYKKVVLVLTNDNKKLDESCLKYLDCFVERKCAKSAIILSADVELLDRINRMKLETQKKTYVINSKKILLLYDFYSYMKFFDNIVFTFTNRPKDNLLGRILAETEITEDEAACLALYHLRTIPG